MASRFFPDWSDFSGLPDARFDAQVCFDGHEGAPGKKLAPTVAAAHGMYRRQRRSGK